ncbi:hypothetical protein CYMTET_39574 [Cymbomonas tetramitiformis]|uniref:Anaphase-promoting complex subunit 1 N-terminal domain-containing protein n=1 Tax=Cymbomonas tetramitiformis TaxID=36881 RepID=A0AAE0F436_9CHLO|nr:hypothetical protein CYMTET_39574 [Cymbomonas tetramitiformis]
MSMRALTPLSYFEPFGAALSRVDAALAPGSEQGVNEESEDNYFLFGGVDENAPDHDEEVYFRGSSVIWSSSRVVRFFFSSLATSTVVIQAVWCNFKAARSSPLLCLLHPGMLTTYSPTGETHTLPLPCAAVSLWPTYDGLLLQEGPSEDGARANDTQQSFLLLHPLQDLVKIEWADNLSTHPLSPTQPARNPGRAQAARQERVLWAGREHPFVVTYNAARARHSLWRVDSEVTEDPVAGGSELTHDLDFLAAELPLQPPFGAPEAAAPAPAPSNLTLALHCIWEEAEDSPPAAEVVLSHDAEGAPLLGFVTRPLRRLTALPLPSDRSTPPPCLSFTLSAESAVGVVATRRLRQTPPRREPHFLGIHLLSPLSDAAHRHIASPSF